MHQTQNRNAEDPGQDDSRQPVRGMALGESPAAKRPRRSLPLMGPQAVNQRALALSQPVTAPDKPDLLEYFAQRGSRVKELEHTLHDLSKTNSDLQTQLASAQTEAKQQQEAARAAAYEAEALKLQYQSERDRLEEAYRREIERTAEACSQLKETEKAKMEAREEAAAATDQLLQFKAASKQEARSLAAEVSHLQRELDAARHDAHRALSVSQRPSLDEQGLQSPALRDMQRQLEEAVTIAESEANKRRKLEHSLAKQEQRAEAAEAALRTLEKSADGSADAIITSLRRELKSQDAEVAEAGKLKDRAKNTAVLQEKLCAAEARLARAEKEHVNTFELQAQVKDLEGQLQRWQAAASSLAISTPDDLRYKLQELRKECLVAADKLGEKAAELRTSNAAVSSANSANAEAEAALLSLQGSMSEMSVAHARMERKVALLIKEREGLQKMLVSYKQEEVADTGPSVESQESSPQAQQIKALEGQVSDLQSQIELLENNLAQAASLSKEQQDKLADALLRASNAEAEHEKVKQDLEMVEREAALLQGRLDKGEFNSETTRVLHFVLNPEAEARREHQQARLAELEAETEVLRTQLQRLEQTATEGPDHKETGVRIAATVLQTEITVLKKKVADLEKREQRLKDVFQKQVANFREAVYYLFGYRVDMASEAAPSAAGKSSPTAFILKPQHADDSRMQLMFRFTKQGTMELLPTEYTTRKLQREVETFIERFKSIPAFTANLTMELFQKQTQC